MTNTLCGISCRWGPSYVERVRKHTDMRELHAFESQKTHGHASIARVSRAILACQCVF